MVVLSSVKSVSTVCCGEPARTGRWRKEVDAKKEYFAGATECLLDSGGCESRRVSGLASVSAVGSRWPESSGARFVPGVVLGFIFTCFGVVRRLQSSRACERPPSDGLASAQRRARKSITVWSSPLTS